MGQVDSTRADAAQWHSQLWDFLYTCAGSGEADQGDRLREALELFRAAPLPFARLLPRLPDRRRFEALLAADAHESAALALLGRDWGYMLSRGPGGVCLATLVMPNRDEDTTAQGDTPALALVLALTSALLAEGAHQLAPGEWRPAGRRAVSTVPGRA